MSAHLKLLLLGPISCAVAVCLAFGGASTARAQAAPPAPPAPLPATAEPAPTPEPTSVTLPPLAPEPGPQRATDGPPAGDVTPPQVPLPPAPIPDGSAPVGAVPPAFPPAIPSLDYGARLRTGIRVQDAKDPEKLNDASMQVDADVYMSGQLHRYFKWQAGVTISYSGNIGQAAAPSVIPLDVIARFEPIPEFNIFMGRMIVVADRYTPSGPWGMDEFFYPGVVPAVWNSQRNALDSIAVALPKSSNTGRDLGVNIWGALLGGHIKYYLGAYQFHDPVFNPLLSGRLQVSLLSPEPAFYQRTTYYGEKDLVSIGVGGQFQKDGSVGVATMGADGMMIPAPPADDWRYFTADLTIDKRLGDAGTISATGGFQKFWGNNNQWDNYFHVALGYTFPQVIGIGKFRPNIRYQQGLDAANGAEATRLIDVQLSYLIMQWFLRFNIGYRRSQIYQRATADAVDGNMLWLGVTYADP